VNRLGEDATKDVESGPYPRLVLPSMVLSRFVIQSPQALLGLLLIDIGVSFGLPVGIMGQTMTAYSLSGFIMAILMGILSVRFNHKNLILTGLGLRVISAIGCVYVQDYKMMLVLYLLNGLGTGLISPMTMTLIAEHLPKEKRAGAISWIVTGMGLSFVVSPLAINYLSGMRGWRFPFLAYILPMTLLSLVLVYSGVPPSRTSGSETRRGDYLEGYKNVLSDRSALACLLGLTLSTLAINGLCGGYFPSYFRQRLNASTSLTSMMMVATALAYVGGSQIAGRVIKYTGSRRLWVIAYVISGMSMVAVFNSSNVWAALALSVLAFVMVGVGYTASNHLTLMQVPQYRGTIMSLFSAANSLGLALGAAIGGMILLSLDYGFLGYGALVSSLASVLVVHTMTEETEKL
jgi:DHA1 family putative efflux transporter-like MFS transporter